MTEAERRSFIAYAASRGPGKRQIKPNTAVLLAASANEADDDDDEDFVAEEKMSVNSSNSDAETKSSSSDEDESGSDSESDDESEDEDEEVESKEKDDSESSEDDSDEHEQVALICALCLNQRESVSKEEVIQCDKCGLAVHENCYMVDSTEDTDSTLSSGVTEPWFCEPCLYGLRSPPYCELCPNRYGAFKRSDIGGGWVHLVCALYTPGVTFGDIDHLSAVSWQEMDYKLFGKKVSSKSNCAKFYKQEEERMRVMHRRVLTQREEKKRQRGLVKHKKLFRSLEGISIAWPEHDNKRPRLLNTSPIFLDLFRDKAAGTGVSHEEFERSFKQVDGAELPFLPPGFSHEFLSYFLAREKVMSAEQIRLRELETEGEELRKQQSALEKELAEVERTMAERVQSPTRELRILQDWYSTMVALGVKKIKKPAAPAREFSPAKQQRAPNTPVGNASTSSLPSRSKSGRRKRNGRVSGSSPTLDDSKSIAPIASFERTPPPMCSICHKSTEQHLLVLCDVCMKHYHLACLDPPLSKMPKKSRNYGWECSMCAEDSDDDGEDSSDEHSVSGSEGSRSARKLRDRTSMNEKRKEEQQVLRGCGHGGSTLSDICAKFYKQEEERMRVMHRRVLTQREEKKRQRGLVKHKKLFRSLEGISIAWPEHDNKRPRLLNTSPIFLDLFRDKAAGTGVSHEEFERSFKQVDGAELPFLPPGFSHEFLSYFLAREKVMSAEQIRLRELETEGEELRKQQSALEKELAEVERTMAERVQSPTRELRILQDWYSTMVALGVKKIKKPAAPAREFSPAKQQRAPNTPVGNASTSSLPSRSKSGRRKRNGRVSGSSPTLDDSKSIAPIASFERTPPPMCSICHKSTEQHLLVLCDVCMKHYHLACLDPPLSKMPKKSRNYGWECSMCAEDSDDDGEDSSDEHSVSGSEGSRSARKLRDRTSMNEKRKEEQQVSGSEGSRSARKLRDRTSMNEKRKEEQQALQHAFRSVMASHRRQPIKRLRRSSKTAAGEVHTKRAIMSPLSIVVNDGGEGSSMALDGSPHTPSERSLTSPVVKRSRICSTNATVQRLNGSLVKMNGVRKNSLEASPRKSDVGTMCTPKEGRRASLPSGIKRSGTLPPSSPGFKISDKGRFTNGLLAMISPR
ncbi:PHD finger protein 14 [Toxocara canis]|uniref:PHD finger protein 14 n=1 Tax=Toxocara canis TaxID=6265 RepID=A0A0B2UTE6_TOXCA|nr:PHD finger protein 14 [Toxocara canis]